MRVFGNGGHTRSELIVRTFGNVRRHSFTSFTSEKRNERVKGIEPSCAAWEAAVLPLNYTREEIFDCRFSIADCNRNKLVKASWLYTPKRCSSGI